MNDMLNLVSNYVRKLLTEELPADIVYHDLMHTLEVVETAKKLAESASLSDEETEIVLIAAWFHDTGYIKTFNGHEDISIEYAKDFLRRSNYDTAKISAVVTLINATKHNSEVSSISEKIIKDSDISHIGKKGYITRTDLLRSEFLSQKKQVFSDTEWLEMNINFISKHDFYTAEAKKFFGETRLENLSKLQRRLCKLSKKKINENKSENSKKEIVINQNTGSLIRGVQTIFRVTSANHIDLSSIADHKANIMIGICAMIISALVSFGMRFFHQNFKFVVPTLFLLTVCLVSMILAILSTRPIVTSGYVSREDVLKKKGNLLFFGNFHRMELDDYVWSMRHLMNDSEYLYDTLVRDIYFLGKVLGKKYEYLRLCYTVFMYGMISSVLAFIITFFI